MSFQHQLSEDQGCQLLALRGRIDSAAAPLFGQAVLDLFDAPGRRVVLDFGAVDYISSAGLRVVLMAAKRARQGQGRLLLCALPRQVREVFEISGFLKIIEAVDERASALRQLAMS
ncbi:MAG: anti-sigma factor antagonist [Roseateles depolymerans]|uniref:Anti-sigma factor antagonist n=1 Tax=Roseateles depolymerans TaxID=76731 RepID=A0A2W5DQG4_9BURK|nr:MAG: anti-sigma factor antagonist [Roseateles depolymerans]